jgi:phage terminase small subunit
VAKSRGLTARQRAFVEAYAGNATDAARKAGYKGSDATLSVTGHYLLRNPKVREAIEKRTSRDSAKRIATREERQEFWTRVMRDDKAEMRDRLKASELLGKSGADFIERHQHEGSVGVRVLSGLDADEVLKLARRLLSDGDGGEED